MYKPVIIINDNTVNYNNNDNDNDNDNDDLMVTMQMMILTYLLDTKLNENLQL